MIVSYHISLNVTADMELFSANGQRSWNIICSWQNL